MTTDQPNATVDNDTTEADPAEVEELPCPWCSHTVKRVEQGGHVKEFCSKRHKTAFNNAVTTAAIEHARLFRTPGALKSWTEARVNPSPADEGGLPRVDGHGAPLMAPGDDNFKQEETD